jgi:hypothetical protein
MKKEVITIPRCYDSHLHWMSSGEVKSTLDLTNIKSYSDLEKINLRQENFRGDWLIGFGWDENLWEDSSVIHHSQLNKIYPNHPVIFSRVDGHAIWVNSVGLKRAQITESSIQNLKGGIFERGKDGKLTGVLADSARSAVDNILPDFTNLEIKNFLFQAMELFHKNGFTHIRDMGGSKVCWDLARQMEESKLLKLYVEMNFSIDKFDDFKSVLEIAINAKKEKTSLLRVGGIKLYFDGALGSNGALLSRNYSNGTNGLELYELNQVEEILCRAWENGIPVAIHTLGDEAVAKIVRLAYDLKTRGTEGLLNLEHCEVVRPETIRMMRGLDIRCHMQPSHFLTDRKWLRHKLGELYSFVFPWKNLEESGINFSFGSDSPIEKPNLSLTSKGIEESSKEGIPRPLKSIWSAHSHPDNSWGKDCLTRLHPDGKIEVVFK